VGGWVDYCPSPKYVTPSIAISLLVAGLPSYVLSTTQSG